MMRAYLAIITQVLRSLAYQKTTILLTLFVCFIIPLSITLFPLFPGKEEAWVDDVTYSMISMICLFYCIIMGTHVLSHEKEDGTLYFYLTNPVRGSVYILAKWVGALLMIALSLLIILVVHGLVHHYVFGSLHIELIYGIFLLLAQSGLFLMFGFLGSLFLPRVTNILFLILCYSLSWLHEDLVFLLHHHGEGIEGIDMITILFKIIPDLSRFDLKDSFILHFPISISEFGHSIANAAVYITILFALTCLTYKYQYSKK